MERLAHRFILCRDNCVLGGEPDILYSTCTPYDSVVIFDIIFS